jgi:hypothetical protein
MANHQVYPLLERYYDDDHRAMKLTDLDPPERLTLLRPRMHSWHSWDECYTPYLERAGLLPLVRVVNYGLPLLDLALLSILVDKWRPKTHTLHFPCGEMTVTLQDVAKIFGLRLFKLPVTRVLNSDTWIDQVEEFYGLRPPDDEQAKQNK